MKPSWNDYFFSMAFLASTRSFDHIKHGCVLVDRDNVIIGIGYNGYPANMEGDGLVRSDTDRRERVAHAEENAVANASRRFTKEDGIRAFVSGSSCKICLKTLRINKVFDIYEAWRPGQTQPEGSRLFTPQYNLERESLIKDFGLNVVQCVPDLSFMRGLLDNLNHRGYIHTELEHFHSKLFNGHA